MDKQSPVKKAFSPEDVGLSVIFAFCLMKPSDDEMRCYINYHCASEYISVYGILPLSIFKVCISDVTFSGINL